MIKFNPILTIISLAFAALIAYLAYNTAEGKDNDTLCGIASGVCFIATLLPVVGLQYESGRLGTNIRIVSVLFFIIFLISHFCFAGFGITMPSYVIVNGLILLIFVAIFYKMSNIKNI